MSHMHKQVSPVYACETPSLYARGSFYSAKQTVSSCIEQHPLPSSHIRYNGDNFLVCLFNGAIYYPSFHAKSHLDLEVVNLPAQFKT